MWTPVLVDVERRSASGLSPQDEELAMVFLVAQWFSHAHMHVDVGWGAESS